MRDPTRKLVIKRWYESIAQLTADDALFTFMNYGYVELDPGRPPLTLTPEQEADRLAHQLYDRTLRGLDLGGAAILDVGCGRGGGAAFLADRDGADSVTGLDHAPTQIDFCRRTHLARNLSFVCGDAERLPFGDGRFDLVTSVEASGGFGDLPRFAHEAARVLRPGGHLALVDLRRPDEVEPLREAMSSAGLSVVSDEDITAGVAAALTDGSEAERHIERGHRHLSPEHHRAYDDLVGAPGGGNHTDLLQGRLQYFRMVFQKPVRRPLRPGRRPWGPDAAWLARHPHEEDDTVQVVQAAFEDFGDVFHYVVPPGVEVFTTRHPDHLHQVLVSEQSIFDKRDDLRAFLGDGLLTSNGDTWRRHRRLVQPAFHRERVVAYTEDFVDRSAACCAQWRDGVAVDIDREMTALTLDVVVKTLFDHHLSHEHTQVSEAMKIVQLNALKSRADSNALREGLVAGKVIDDMVRDILRQRRTAPSNGPDLLSHLIHARDDQGSLSESELRDELVTLFMAGHETTARALTWAWILLADHPLERRRLHQELDAVLDGRPPTGEDYDRLPFTRRVALETLRLYPPAYSLPRRCTKSTTIGPYRVREGAEVICSVYHCQRDPRWFAFPESFDPQRWAPGSGRVRNLAAFQPFSSGPRACVGKHFALIEMVMVLATVAQRFQLDRVDDRRVEHTARITLTPRGAVQLRPRLREAIPAPDQ